MSNVAEIGVRIVADATKLQAGLQKALDALDSFGNKFQRAANKVAAVGAAITAVGAKMIADAAKYDRNVKAAVDGLGKAYDNLAVRIGSALIPAIEAVTKFVAQLVRAWDSLSPAQRKTIADLAELTAKVLVFIGVAGGIIGFVGDIAGLAAVLLPLVVPLVAIAAGLAGIALLLGAGYGAWKEYGAAISSATKTGFDAVTDFAQNYFAFMVDNLKSLANFWIGLAKTIVDANKQVFASLTPVGWVGGKNPILEGAGSALDAISARVNGPSGIGAAIRGAGDSLLEAGKSVVGAAKDGIVSSLKNFAELTGLDSMVGKFAKMFDEAGTSFADKTAKGIKSALAVYTEAHPGAIGPTRVSAMEGFQTSWGTGFRRPEARRIREGTSGAVQMRGLDKIQALDAYAERFTTTFASIGASLGAAGMTLVSKLGKFGQAVQAGIQGFQSGGVWGAIIAVFAELISGTQAFQRAIDIANGSFTEIAGAFEGLVEGIQPLLTVITMIVSQVINGLEPVFTMLGDALGMLAPILLPIAQLFAAIGPLFQLVAMSLKPMFDVLKIVIDVIAKVLSGVIYVILKVVRGIGWVWNAIIGALWDVLASIAGALKTDAFDGLLLSISSMGISLSGLDTAIDNVSKIIQGDTGTAGDLIDAQSEAWRKVGAGADGAANALNQFSESLTNVPQGFKVAAARFNAMSAGGGGGYGNTVDAETSRAGVHITVQGNIIDAAGLLAIIEASGRKGSFRRTGSPVPA